MFINCVVYLTLTLMRVYLTDSPLEEQRFFVTQNTSGDDDAAFKERLKNMGKGTIMFELIQIL